MTSTHREKYWCLTTFITSIQLLLYLYICVCCFLLVSGCSWILHCCLHLNYPSLKGLQQWKYSKLNSSKPAVLFSYHKPLSSCCRVRVEEMGLVGLKLWYNLCPTALVTWMTASEGVSVTTPTHSWLSSLRLCVSFALSSPAMVSQVALCLTSTSFSSLWVCVWACGSTLTTIGSLHCGDVPVRGCIDFSIWSSSSACQSFYLKLSPV